ncbi:MAG: hypothetical protein J5585_02450 [Clostridia bacterium]|nr:hypothetical protein [Clostridia bacterium]
MKKLALLLLIPLLLCSCRRGPDKPVETDTTAETVTEPAVTADLELLDSARGFVRVHDDELDAEWITPEGASGLFARILVYGADKISFRVILEGGGDLVCGENTYAITGGDVLADEALLSVIRAIASGTLATAAGREVTESERGLLKKTVELYDAALGKPYIIDTASDPGPETTVSDGVAVYECAGYLIKFPSSFLITEDDGGITIVSDTHRLRTVRVAVSDSPFNENINDPEAVESTVSSLGGTLISNVVELKIGGRNAYAYSYEKDGVFIRQYFVDGGQVTYILTGASYDGGDEIPKNIISTFQVK